MKHEAGDAVARRPLRDARVPSQQAERAAIFRQHIGAEPTDALLLARAKDLVEADRAETESLPAVRHDETDVGDGLFVRRAVPRHADQFGLLPRVDLSDERHPLAIVDVGEGVHLRGKEPPGGEEALVHRVRTQPVAERQQARPVGGTDRTHANRGAVAQSDNGLTAAAVSTVPGGLDLPGASQHLT
jgi:hypothetical protein